MKTFVSTLIWFACAGLIVPPLSAETLLATCTKESPTQSQPFVQDVALNAEQELMGKLVDRSGVPLEDVALELIGNGIESVATTTDPTGTFRFPTTCGGLYAVSSGELEQTCRVWAADTAPPSASNGLLMVADNDQVERGQSRRRRNPPNRQRRRRLARIGFKGATLPFTMVGALGAAAARKQDRDEEAAAEAAAEEEANGDSNGDVGSAS